MVEPAQNIVVIDYDHNIPMDLVVTPSTHIESGQSSIKLKSMSQFINKSVSIRFVPERRGDVAESIRITG